MSNVVNLPVAQKPAKTLRTDNGVRYVAVRITAEEADAIDLAAAPLGISREDMAGRMLRRSLLFFKALEEEGL